MKPISILLVISGTLLARAPQAPMAPGDMPLYRASVTSKTVKAVNYQHRSGATRIDFQGTDLLPQAHGEAKVESKQGAIQIETEFRNLQPATKFGAEYLTYVLWAVTPEGRTANLGEVLLNGTNSKLNVTTELQVFGLIVTAEPYYAVTKPSDLIVMENMVRKDTVGKVEEIDAKYELLQRGVYQRLSNPLALKLDRKVPLELYEARNAVHIARAEGADVFAGDTFLKAEKSLADAEAYQARKAGVKPVIMTAREAVQTSEDARIIAVKRQEDQVLAAEREQSLNREKRAEEAKTAAQTETNRMAREAAAAQAETGRVTQEAAAAHAAAESDKEHVAAENNAKTAAAQAEADRLRQENASQKAAIQSELDAATAQKAQLQAEKAALRTQLLAQFNAILQTRDTARGLIVNMSDVLFDSGKFTLRPQAREKLAKVAGIVSGHPSLILAVEGYTDSVGGDEYNQRLSEQRGGSVRDYLTQEGMPAASVTSRGFGKAQPVASNDTASGRQQNRRVEIVISGDVIGTEIGTPIAAR